MSEQPTQEQFDIAALWLDANEGFGDECVACRAVAAWIRQESFEKILRSEARAAGITVASLRRRHAAVPQSSTVARATT